ncbi:MAG: phosphatase PAP2 family protein, partial [Armatimonadetes bacterium]|nr:phosphatase PAP2 family protein [Armatimonadota bacterium]
ILVVKALGGTGTFTQGGLISGHAAVAFASTTMILCLTRSKIATLLALLIAILVAQSRVEAKFHRLIEVFLGALIGITCSLIIYMIFYNLKY